MKRIILFLGLCATLFKSYSQSCQTKPLTQQEWNHLKTVSTYANMRVEAVLRYVPVKVNIVRYADGTGGVNLADVLNAIAMANKHFGPSGIQFFVAGQIREIKNDAYAARTDTNDWWMESYDVAGCINAYFNPAAANTCAYSTGGSRIAFFGTPCLSGAPHEFGHQFSLIHTQGQGPGFPLEYVDGSNCTTAGDLVCDTPADYDGSANYTNQCVYSGTQKDPKGKLYTPPITNIMAYSSCNDPAEYGTFTSGQISRIVNAASSLSFSFTEESITAPTNLSGSLFSSGVSLSWSDNSSNEVGFLIERSVNTPDNFVGVGSTLKNMTSYKDYTAPIGKTIYYRIKPFNSSTKYSNTFQISSGLSYCVSIHNSTVCDQNDFAYISKVKITTGTTSVLNASSTCPLNTFYRGYSDYTASFSPTVAAGSTLAFEITNTAAGCLNTVVFLDLNRNGLFTDAGETIQISPTCIQTVSFNFTIPASLSAGKLRLRVRSVGSGEGIPTDPCKEYFYGETEDYELTVTATTTQYILASSATNGTIQLNPSGGSYSPGTLVTVTATPSAGYQFSAWGGALSGSTNPQTVTMDANKSISATFVPAAPTTQFCLEAESALGQASFAPFQVVNDANASGGKYIVVPNGTGNQALQPTNSIGTYSFNVTTAGTYNIWLRIIAQTSNDNSLSIRADAASFTTWTPGTYTSWTWKKWTPQTFATGTHTISVARNEDGLQIDKIIVTQSSSTPSGVGCIQAREAEASMEETVLESNAMEITPNPNSGQFTISVRVGQSSSGTVEILNSLGENQSPAQSITLRAGENVLNYDISELKCGLYFMRMNTPQISLIKKIIKE